MSVHMIALSRPLSLDDDQHNPLKVLPGQSFVTDEKTAQSLEARGLACRDHGQKMMLAAPENKMLPVPENKTADEWPMAAVPFPSQQRRRR